MTSKITADYESLSADAASYMLAPVKLGPELKYKVTAEGSGTRNPTASGIPLFTDYSTADYIGDESKLRPKMTRHMPLSLEEGREYAEFMRDADDTEQVLAAISKDVEMMKTSEFNREIDVVPVSDMSDPGKGQKIFVSDFSAADAFRAVAPSDGRKKPDGPSVKFVHFKDAYVDKPYAAYP